MRRFVLALALLVGDPLPAPPAIAQNAPHDMARMSDASSTSPLDAPMSRRGSGTSWLPDFSSSRMVDGAFRGWTIMVDGAAFALNDQQQTLHGGAQWAVLDWEMATASRRALGGLLQLDLMTSAESFILPDSGYHELLQTGEVMNGHRRADMQHPHAPLMELSSEYQYPVTNVLASFVYAGVVGEPALGPPAYLNRPSAEADPFAPIGHHWQDASHESVGVVTTGLFTRAVKLEGSVFNARERSAFGLRTDLRDARLDSYAGRLTVLPHGRVALSAWAGYLANDDPLTPGLGMQRYGASMLTVTRAPRRGSLATTVIWGMNVHHHSERLHVHDSTSNQRLSHPTSSVLLESTWRLSRASVYGRLEQVQKMADDFAFLGGDLAQLFAVRTVSVGATREIAASRGLAAGVGARAALNLIPAALEPTYQTRRAAGFVLYVTLQPATVASPGTSMDRPDSSR